MKNTIILLSSFLLILLSCNKDKFETVPQLKFISKSSDIVDINGNLQLTLEFTDKEGDVSDTLYVIRERLNVRGPVTLFPSPYPIPKFPLTKKGQFEVVLNYQFGLIFGLTPLRVIGSNPPKNEPDTLNLRFVARDKAGNKSDTVTVKNIFVIR